MSDLSPQKPANKPGRGLFGWLGRQIGYVTKAVHTDVTPPPPPAPAPAPPETIYRETTVEEIPHPQDPSIKLRRTTIDEARREEKT